MNATARLEWRGAQEPPGKAAYHQATTSRLNPTENKTMNIAGTIDCLLNRKGTNVWSIDPDATIFEAIRLMAEKNIGALLVMRGEKLVGIFSERDYARKVVLKGKTSKQTPVREIISNPVISVEPGETVEECMRLMTEHRVRHLPVLDAGKVVGIVSIGDLVNWIISAQSVALTQMEDYISGKYPG
jgi:CBS domain-containing protein